MNYQEIQDQVCGLLNESDRAIRSSDVRNIELGAMPAIVAALVLINHTLNDRLECIEELLCDMRNRMPE
jgi:hypothetical protein